MDILSISFWDVSTIRQVASFCILTASRKRRGLKGGIDTLCADIK